MERQNCEDSASQKFILRNKYFIFGAMIWFSGTLGRVLNS
ncbi:hypothetical protein XBI1_350006 [Xenorhabdus bovienii str. Intermedium]|uniref:Uncharacterized protein n=1 Tax=Xenorhabdus bovienii str. Intermedium TaxID=1379677 RepID=A0A077QMN4_XENBV|nr:hypothetical protein XBI1_350006 [Xenorhabdus bovienii str. Intermedium]